METDYPISISRLTRVRDVFRLRTDKGNLCAKGYDIPLGQVRFIAQVLCHLEDAGFRYGPHLLRTRSQSLWMVREDQLYMLTNWVNGTEPDFHDRAAFSKAIRALAKFHLCAEGLAADDIPKKRQRYQSLQKLIQSYRAMLNKHAAIADMTRFTSLCDTAVDRLSHRESAAAIEREQSVRAFVHGDYNYPNLIVDKRGEVHLIDFDNTALQARMTDLAHLLQRNFAWKGNETLRWIARYDRIRPIGSEDRHLLYALLHVPSPLIRAIRLNKSTTKIKAAMPHPRVIERYVDELGELS